MNNKQLSWTKKYNNNHFIIASRAYFQQYAMLCTRPIVYLTMSLARGYNSDPEVDHWTTVKIILSYLRGLRKYFSVMEVIKEFIVKSYIDASFYADPDDSKSQSGYILKAGAISKSSSVQEHCWHRNLQNTYGSEYSRPVD